MIEAVLFDIDGVLMDSREANVAWYRELLAGHGYRDLGEQDLARGHYSSLRESIAFLTQADGATVETIFEDARHLRGYPYELVRLPDDCDHVLQSLSMRYRLGIVTSRIQEGVQQFMDFSRLSPALFSTVVGYDDTTLHKPDAAPLLLACERLEVAPAAAVYVGDAASDMASARAAGVHFIAFGDAIPDARPAVRRMIDLEAMIRGMDR